MKVIFVKEDEKYLKNLRSFGRRTNYGTENLSLTSVDSYDGEKS